MEIIQLWDTSLFLFINSFHSSFFDGFMFAVSEKLTWIPLYLALLYIVIKKWKREAIWIVLALILCIVISDQISSGLIKNLVQRLRPSHNDDLQGMIHFVNGYKGGKYGFVSSHAANSFGLALLTSLLFKNRIFTISIFSWASITAYSRIYLGVHYPFDIVGGIVVGLIAAIICYLGLTLIKKISFKNTSISSSIPTLTVAVTFLLIICYSIWFF